MQLGITAEAARQVRVLSESGQLAEFLPRPHEVLVQPLELCGSCGEEQVVASGDCLACGHHQI